MIYATALLKLAPLVEWQVAFWAVGPSKFPEFSPQARRRRRAALTCLSAAAAACLQATGTNARDGDTRRALTASSFPCLPPLPGVRQLPLGGGPAPACPDGPLAGPLLDPQRGEAEAGDAAERLPGDVLRVAERPPAVRPVGGHVLAGDAAHGWGVQGAGPQ